MRLGLIGSTGHWKTYAPGAGDRPGPDARRGRPRRARRRRSARSTTPRASRRTRDATTTRGRCSKRSGWTSCRSAAATIGYRPGSRACLERGPAGDGGEAAGDGPAHARGPVPRRAGDEGGPRPDAHDAGRAGAGGDEAVGARRRRSATPCSSSARRPTSGGRPARNSIAAARRSPASRRGWASTPSTGCTGSSATSSPRSMGARGPRRGRTTPPAPARPPSCWRCGTGA